MPLQITFLVVKWLKKSNFHCEYQQKHNFLLTLNDAGRGVKMTRWSGDRLPFLTGSCYGHKNSWLYPKTSQLESTKVIFWLSWQVFFYFFVTKTSNFISNMNDDFDKDSFEVHYISVRQKLVILGFLPKTFFNFDLSHFRNLLRPNYELQWPHWGLKF